MTLGKVHHVASLEEALSSWAAAKAAGHPLPTFTTTIDKWPSFAADTRHSYTVEHEDNGRQFRWTGVQIYVLAISKAPEKTL